MLQWIESTFYIQGSGILACSTSHSVLVLFLRALWPLWILMGGGHWRLQWKSSILKAELHLWYFRSNHLPGKEIMYYGVWARWKNVSASGQTVDNPAFCWLLNSLCIPWEQMWRAYCLVSLTWLRIHHTSAENSFPKYVRLEPWSIGRRSISLPHAVFPAGNV